MNHHPTVPRRLQTPRGTGKLTPDQLPLAQKAVNNCPERAIEIVEDDE